MSMISQGFPLWAVEPDGTPHIVVGWDEHGYPHTVPASAPGLGLADFPDGTWFTFTTTDPSAQPDAVADPAGYVTVSRIYGMTPQEIADELAKADDLRERLRRLAYDMEGMDRTGTEAAHAILAELDK